MSVCEIEIFIDQLCILSNFTYGAPSDLFNTTIELKSIGMLILLDLIAFIIASLAANLPA